MPTNYQQISFDEVKGYNKLSDGAKMVFAHVYRKHNSNVGEEHKKDWIPTNVSMKGSYLKVTFRNGEWLHYYPNGTWA